MATTNSNPSISDRRWFSIRPQRPLWFFPAMVALWLAAAVARAADGEGDENGKEGGVNEELNVEDTEFNRFIFRVGGDLTLERMRKRQEQWLPLKIAIVDRVCGLTDSQKEKLRLAGQGDIKRLFDQVEETRRRVERVQNDREKLRALSDELRPLRWALSRIGLSEDDVLFGKILEMLLTAEQRARYEPLRAAVSAGCTIEILQFEPNTILTIRGDWSRIVDDDLTNFSQLTDLTFLTLESTHVTDGGLGHLKGMENLGSLSLTGTNVTDAGLAHLEGMQKLDSLSLSGTKVTDAGLEHLSPLKNLTSLSLAGTKVTDAGLAHLAALKNLTSLSLAGTKVTDAGLAHLAALENLERLSLQETPVTDAGLAHLKRLKRLQNLELDDTQISDAGLAHLKGMASLWQILLDRTGVTPGGIADLKKALPNLRFDR
jgi:Leucine-rich repeat (LRR) protein